MADTKLDKLEQKVDARLNKLDQKIDSLAQQTDAKFAKLEQKIDARSSLIVLLGGVIVVLQVLGALGII